MNARTTSRFVRPHQLIALAALLGVAGCGACNCNVPGFHAPAPGVTPLPPGVTPTPTPLPTPTSTPIASTSCSQGAAAVALGPALAPFAVLAGSTVTNVGTRWSPFGSGGRSRRASTTTSDLIGVSPGTAVDRFYPRDRHRRIQPRSMPPGTTRTPAVPLAAQVALTTAYGGAGRQSRRCPRSRTAKDLSQASVVGSSRSVPCRPGVYRSASSLSIMAGNLTLDGGGNAQSVFIFQMGRHAHRRRSTAAPAATWS